MKLKTLKQMQASGWEYSKYAAIHNRLIRTKATNKSNFTFTRFRKKVMSYCGNSLPEALIPMLGKKVKIFGYEKGLMGTLYFSVRISASTPDVYGDRFKIHESAFTDKDVAEFKKSIHVLTKKNGYTEDVRIMEGKKGVKIGYTLYSHAEFSKMINWYKKAMRK